MCIPPINDEASKFFSILRKEGMKNNLFQLSMGMSSDYFEAIKHNASYIRIGTLLFGERS